MKIEISTNKNAALLASAQRVRTGARLAGALIIVLCFALGGKIWAWGAWMGAFLVEINLGFLYRFLQRAQDWSGTGLRPTLFRFYLAFGATALLCFLVIRNQWGHPLGFLLGLLSFAVGLGAGLISLTVRPVKA